MKNAVYEPLKDKVKEFADRIENFNEDFETRCKSLTHSRQELVQADTRYLLHSKALSEVLRKVEYNSKNRTANFYDEKLFTSLNSKMKQVDVKAKELEGWTDSLNHQIADFKQSMTEGIKDLEKMEEDRVQALIDALNQINVFQTNCDMNNKYDSNNFYESVESIKTEESTNEYKNLCREVDITKVETYNFHPYDELMTNEDIEMHEVNEEKEKEHQRQVQEFIDKCKSETGDLTSADLENFSDLMNLKINRYCFATTLNRLEDHSLPNEKCYKNMAKLVMGFLKACNKNDDSDFLKCILTVASKIYYDIEEVDDAIIRTYLTEGIRKNKIWDNNVIWGKAIFKDFRDIIRKFKLSEDQQKELNKDEVLRNVLFNRLLFYIDNLSYFDMEGNQLLTICNRFSSIYKFTNSQNNLLLK